MLHSPARLDALRRTGLLDSPREEAFDRLTRLASRALSAPVSLLCLVADDRQFLKSSAGLPEQRSSLRSQPPDCSFCRHVVGTGAPIIVADARKHPLGREDAAIIEAGAIAYVGVPLRTRDGHVLGTLCVCDVVPREWSDSEIATLTDLAESAMTEIALRHELVERERFERELLGRTRDIERQRLSTLFEEAPAFITWTLGPTHVIQGANRAFYQLVGHRDIIGRTIADAIPEAETHGLLVEIDHVVATGVPFVANGMRMLVQRTPHGSPEERFLNFVYQPLLEADGAPCGMMCYGVDVTEQVRASADVSRNEAYYRSVLDSLPVIVYRTDLAPPYDTTYVSAAIESLGFTREEWLGTTGMWATRLHPDDRARVRREASEAQDRAESYDSRYRLIARDGSVRWIHDRGEHLPDRSGEHCVWQGMMMDVTAQHEAEEALRESEARHRLTFDEAGIGMAVCFVDGRIDRANRALAEFLGYEQGELERLNYRQVTHPDELESDAIETGRLLAGAITNFSRERRYLRKDGQEVWGLVTVAVLRDAAGAPTRRLAQVQDITDRKRSELALRAAEEALRESEARYRNIVENAPGMVYQWMYRPDGTGCYTFVSEGTEAVLGVTPAAALKDPEVLLGLIPPEDRPQFIDLARSAARDCTPLHWEGRVVLRSGAERYIEVRARDHRRPDGTVLSDGIVIDITERHQLEQQLRQAQKMEAVGQLAGGVAHDFNNLITIIKASTSFLLADLDPADARRDDVREIPDAAHRAAALTRQLLAFSRKQILNRRVTSLGAVIENLRPMLTRLIGEDIVVETRLADDVGTIWADVGQLEQALINLAVNARDAMRDGGRLTIETAEVRVDEKYAAAHTAKDDVVVRPGTYLMLTVSDTGSGMTPEVRARAFEPFFTTKAAGKGTGLGLSTVYGIVKQSGGHVWVYSEPGHGTVFKLCFPVLKDQAEPLLDVPPPELSARGSETILLVEDEEGLRRLARRILERHGYHVLESSNGREALELATRHEAPIHLVLTDVIMPELNGRALVERLREVRPATAVVYMSGYTDDDVLRRELFEPGAHFAQKPFLPEELLRLVRETLDRRL